MTSRRVLWGLSSGVAALTLGGFFWFGLGVSAPSARVSPALSGVATVVQLAVTIVLLAAARRLGKRAGVRRRDASDLGPRERGEMHAVAMAFLRVLLAEAIVCAASVWLCMRAHRVDLVWPVLGLATSLHFAPLARIFHVRPYLRTAAWGVLASLAGLLAGTPLLRQVVTGASLGVVLWMSALHLLRHADQLAQHAAIEPWAAAGIAARHS